MKPGDLRVVWFAALLFAVLCNAVPPVADPAAVHGNRAAQASARLASASVRWGRRAGKSANDEHAWVYAVGGKGLIIVSLDAGSTWAPLESGVTVDLFDVACTHARNCLVVGDKGTVLSTSNLGNAWEVVEVDGLGSVKAPLRGLYIMQSSPTMNFIVGDKGLFVSRSADGEPWNAIVLNCGKIGQQCLAANMPASEGAWKNRTSSLTLVGASFRDVDNGLLIAAGGEIIIVRGMGALGEKAFTLQKPITITGTQFYSISNDKLGDIVISGSNGVVMQYKPMYRKEDDGVDWRVSTSIANDNNIFNEVLSADAVSKLSDAEAKAWNLKANWMLNLDTSRNKQILAVGTQGYVGIYNGTAGGWTRKTQAIDPLHPLQTYEAAYMPSKDTLIVATNDAKMYKSEDAGATFKKIDMAPVFEKWSTTSSKSDLGGRSVIRMAGINAEETSDGTQATASCWLLAAALSLQLLV